MIVVEESMDTKIQQMAYQFFQYLTTRDLKGKRIPDPTSKPVDNTRIDNI